MEFKKGLRLRWLTYDFFGRGNIDISINSHSSRKVPTKNNSQHNFSL